MGDLWWHFSGYSAIRTEPLSFQFQHCVLLSFATTFRVQNMTQVRRVLAVTDTVHGCGLQSLEVEHCYVHERAVQKRVQEETGIKQELLCESDIK